MYCLVPQDPTLEELYMSHTNLMGPLPDTIGADSSLRVLYAINQPPGDGLTGESGGVEPSLPSLCTLNTEGSAVIFQSITAGDHKGSRSSSISSAYHTAN